MLIATNKQEKKKKIGGNKNLKKRKLKEAKIMPWGRFENILPKPIFFFTIQRVHQKKKRRKSFYL
jgi:hypothetical protein